MRFWDSSAVVPLLVEERNSAATLAAFEQDPEVLVWWGTELECVSALARQEREGALSARSLLTALERLDALSLAWREVLPVATVRQVAIRLLRVHPLRTGDALQLAAAVVGAENLPATLPFVTVDDRLGQAAQREGFAVVTPEGIA